MGLSLALVQSVKPVKWTRWQTSSTCRWQEASGRPHLTLDTCIRVPQSLSSSEFQDLHHSPSAWPEVALDRKSLTSDPRVFSEHCLGAAAPPWLHLGVHLRTYVRLRRRPIVLLEPKVTRHPPYPKRSHSQSTQTICTQAVLRSFNWVPSQII